MATQKLSLRKCAICAQQGQLRKLYARIYEADFKKDGVYRLVPWLYCGACQQVMKFTPQ